MYLKSERRKDALNAFHLYYINEKRGRIIVYNQQYIDIYLRVVIFDLTLDDIEKICIF